MDHTINESDVQIHVQSAILDDTRTRLDIQIYAAAADVTGQWMSKGYNKLEIKSLYGIYDRCTSKLRLKKKALASKLCRIITDNFPPHDHNRL